MEDPKTSFLEFKERATQNHSFSNHEDQNLHWLHPIKVTLGILRERSLNLSIYKVPIKLQKLNEEAYTPRLVSIGPFHRSKHDLLTMEEHKWRHMLSLLHRTTDPDHCLNEIGKALVGLAAKARGSYAESINFDAHQLYEIMLVDGCFIIELFLRHSLRDIVDCTDPILNNAWMVPTIRHDLALLENQIPFFVLQHLFSIVVSRIAKPLPLLISDISLSFFHPELDMKIVMKKEKCSHESRHLLDLLHIFYLPESPRVNASKGGKENWGFKNCATTLLEAGIEFEKGLKSEDLLNIKFSNGVIKIPELCIHETTNSLLRNLIAFEQCSLGDSTHHVTSYIVLMKSLVHSLQDVELLQKKGIIANNLDGVDEVLSLFNGILKEVVLKDFYFGKLCEEVNEYHKSCWHWQRHKAFWRVRWHRYIAALKRDYFSNPWRIIAFFAAVLLLLLTGVQTVCTNSIYRSFLLSSLGLAFAFTIHHWFVIVVLFHHVN